jgi:hypothetical protein
MYKGVPKIKPDWVVLGESAVILAMPKSRILMRGRPSSPREKEILRLEVAMNDSHAVRLVERQRDLPEPLDDRRRLDATAGREVLEVDSFEQVHDEIRNPAQLRRHVRVEDADDVLASDLGDRTGLALEPRDRVRRRAQVRPHELQREELAGKGMLDGIDGAR